MEYLFCFVYCNIDFFLRMTKGMGAPTKHDSFKYSGTSLKGGAN